MSSKRALRATTISVHNGAHSLDILTRRAGAKLYEMWMVGLVGRQRMVMSHYLTHDDLQARLFYAKKGDLSWREAAAEIPKRYAAGGLVMGRTLPAGNVMDHERLVHHLPIPGLTVDRRTLAAARRLIPGAWSDGNVRLTLASENALRLTPRAPAGHPLASPASWPSLVWWRFSAWQIFLMDASRQCGLRRTVLNVDESEIHLGCGGDVGGNKNQIAHVLRRVGA